MSKSVLVKDIKVILCDIEGTTTPISFVKSILFPYITNNVSQFLKDNASQDWFVKFLEECNIQDLEENLQEEIIRLMSKDSKIPWLKKFQGLMWEHAYNNSLVKGQVYSDFPEFLKRFSGIFRIGIYSSGSIKAQKLLFSFTENNGNLLEYLQFHFDTTIGLKTLSSSYTLISQDLQVEPSQILFLSDSTLEIQAAKNAGLKAIRVDRDHLYSCNGVVHSFDELELEESKEPMLKKRKI